MISATDIPSVLIGEGRKSEIITTIAFVSNGKSILVREYSQNPRCGTGPTLDRESKISSRTLSNLIRQHKPNSEEKKALEESFGLALKQAAAIKAKDKASLARSWKKAQAHRWRY